MSDRFEAAEGLVVRPIGRGERARFDAELAAHHWLGCRLVGEVMRYVAVDGEGRWLAVAGFGAAARSCRVRDGWIGWDREQQRRRLPWVVGNQRLCVLPDGRRPNVASAVLGRALKRLAGDYERVYGHAVVAVEAFVDPARHAGTCYAAAGFCRLGETLGYRRQSGRWRYHGHPKVCWVRTLRRDARRLLAAPFDHPVLTRRRPVVIDLNQVDVDGLLERLSEVTDPRKRRGRRHSLASVLAIAACAKLAGMRDPAAIGEWAADAPQEVLARLGARWHADRQRYIAPHDATIRRALAQVDADELDAAVGRWLADQFGAGRLDAGQLAVAVDGKSLRGAVGADGQPLKLLAAMTHEGGAVVGQREVPADRSEIDAFPSLLASADLQGVVVTADALHAQRDHAARLADDHNADYVFAVKGNQPGVAQTIDALDEGDFSP